MPKLLLQIVDFSGAIIDNAKWEIDFPSGLQQDQTISINLPIKDPALINYIGKQNSLSCVIDKEDNKFMVAIACLVTRIRHMVNTTTKAVESMVILRPNDRTCEHILKYLLTPAKCDQRFIILVRGVQKIIPSQD
jgi:hypothetical protein